MSMEDLNNNFKKISREIIIYHVTDNLKKINYFFEILFECRVNSNWNFENITFKKEIMIFINWLLTD